MFSALLTDSAILERELLTRDQAHALERLVSRLAAVDRYRIVRKYAAGVVADVACGCGFGTAMLARCPTVTRAHGWDLDQDAIAFAAREYGAPDFAVADVCSAVFADVMRAAGVETVVSVETLEHLADPCALIDNVMACGARRFVATFPSFVTSTFNPYHLSDVTLEDVEAMLGRVAWRSFTLADAVVVAVFDL